MKVFPVALLGIFSLFLTLSLVYAQSSPIICEVDGKPMQTQGKIAGIAANTSVLETMESVSTFSAILKEAGINKATRGLRWDHIEKVQGTYNWDYVGTGEGLHDSATATLPVDTLILKPGLTPQWASSCRNCVKPENYPPEDVSNWVKFVTAAVERYGHGPGGSGKVRNWEPWNEPDGGEYFHGTSQQYLEINNTAYDAIKSVDPSAVVWAPGMIVWPDTLVTTANGLRVPEKGEAKYDQYKKRWELFYLLMEQGKFDGFSYHAYGPDSHIYKVTQALKQKLSEYPAHSKKQLMLSETNLPVGIPWTNCPYDSISELDQKATLEQRYACSFNAGADIALWFPIRDRTNRNCHDGLLRDGIIRRDYTTKPSFDGLKQINQLLNQVNQSCAGITIDSVQTSCSHKGLQTTVMWNPITDASQYVIAYDDDPNFWSDQHAGREVGEPVAWEIVNRSTWSHIFSDGKKRYFIVRVSKSSACIPNTSAFGQAKSVDSQACYASDLNNDGWINVLDYEVIENNYTQYSLYNISQIINYFGTQY